MVKDYDTYIELKSKARQIKLLLTDNDGVLTDAGVYYSAEGEELKRFSLRDGMGVERLRNVDIEVGLITGENSGAVAARAKKLQITELHLGIKDKLAVLRQILELRGLSAEQIAYIGDDMNDLEIIKHAGLTACPVDAFPAIAEVADYVCKLPGGHGAFREFAEFIIAAGQAE